LLKPLARVFFLAKKKKNAILKKNKLMPYPFIIIPLLAGFLAQILKIFFSLPRREWRGLNVFTHYGGMPSAHAAFVSSLGALLVIYHQVATPLFGLWLIFFLLTIRDAFGLRQEISAHARALNKLAKKNNLYLHLRERLGHRLPEIAAGIILGISLPLFIWLCGGL